ncbi:DUF309 domain-containing protein [bacterium]|nr:MAG: DUF309 domain-containing protein [bacterium]MCL4232046.1 DUF309 domain-containing protein [Dehalococcoidia bacterium]
MGSADASVRRRQVVTRRITVPGCLELATAQFNEGLFFECHETLEDVWRHEPGPLGELYKGIIQVAAAFVHRGRGKVKGAESLFASALAYLAPFRADGAMGFDVEALCLVAERARNALRANEPRGSEPVAGSAETPVLRWEASGLASEAVRWGAWGFDERGDPMEMEITAIE